MSARRVGWETSAAEDAAVWATQDDGRGPPTATSADAGA